MVSLNCAEWKKRCCSYEKQEPRQTLESTAGPVGTTLGWQVVGQGDVISLSQSVGRVAGSAAFGEQALSVVG